MRVAHRAVEVDDVHQGVRRGLDEGEPGALAGRREPVRVGRAVAPHLDTERRQRPGCEQLDLVVPGVGDHEDRALAQHGEAQAGPGRHPAREGQRMRLLERAEQGLRLGRRR